MKLRRFKDIIAVQTNDSLTKKDMLIAFHPKNLELALISEEIFNTMSDIEMDTDSAPSISTDSLDPETYNLLSDWENELNPNVKSGKIDFKVRSININVNQICNLKCNYCAAGGDGTYGESINKISVEKTLPQLKSFLDKLEPGNKFSISFVGGEPLLYLDGLVSISKYLQNECREKKLTSSIQVVTNGTLINEKNISTLSDLELTIKVSLDGPKEINDLIRPSKNLESSTEKTLTGIKLLNKYRGKIKSVGIAAVYSKQNVDLYNNYIFFKSLNVDWFEFNFEYSENSTELLNDYIEKMNLIANKAWNDGGEAELRKVKLFDHYFKLLDNQQLVENHCGAGKSFLMVDSKNTLYPCVWSPGKSSEVVGHNSTIYSEKISKYSESLVKLNNCESCWARNLCGGGCMYINEAHSGNKHIKNKLFCIRTRSLILSTFIYYKMSRSLA